MVSDHELDPFQRQITIHGVQSSKKISPDDITNIVSSVDCIRYHKEFLEFIKIYWLTILVHQETILSIIRISIAIEEICKSDLRTQINGLAERYEAIITEIPIRELDVDIALNMLRCFLEYGRPVKLCLLALSARIISLKSDDELSDVYNVISNHRDVLENVYHNDALVEYGYVLDDTISETFPQ